MTPLNTGERATVRRPVVKRDLPVTSDLHADMQIRAIGRWNEQFSDRVITRQNGFASYTLLKSAMNRSMFGAI